MISHYSAKLMVARARGLEGGHMECLGIPKVRVKIQEHLSLQRSRIGALAEIIEDLPV